MSPHFRRHARESGPATALLHMLDQNGPPPYIVCAGQQIDLHAGASLQVLWPPSNCGFNSNDTGLVLRLTYAGRSILFPADIQVPAESELLRRPAGFLRADVLVAPHHGSSESTSTDFVHTVAAHRAQLERGSPHEQTAAL